MGKIYLTRKRPTPKKESSSISIKNENSNQPRNLIQFQAYIIACYEKVSEEEGAFTIHRFVTISNTVQ
jgi:hypothetical protein